MTEQEWALFAAEVEATFRGDLAEDRELALREHVGSLPLDVARRCVRWMVSGEMVLMPAPGDFMRAMRSLVPDDWHRRRLLAGRSIAEQVDQDRAEVERVLRGGPRRAALNA